MKKRLKQLSFHELTTEVIEILEDVISNTDRLFDEEMKIINYFLNRQWSEEEENLKRKIVGIEVDYFAFVDLRNPENPENKVHIDKLLARLKSVNNELSQLVVGR